MATELKSDDLPYYVLDFFHDEEGASALTILLHGLRFHIIVDPQCLEDASQGRYAREYTSLLQSVKRLYGVESVPEDGDWNCASSDSGVDLRDGEQSKNATPEDREAHGRLHTWMLAPLHNVLRDRAPGDTQSTQTLKNWYSCKTLFYNLETRRGKLEAVELEPDADLAARMDNLVPKLTVPKYIRDIDTPWYKASELEVLACSDALAPYHPAVVRSRKNDDTYFLKLVDPSQPQPTKREIQLLDRIDRKGLREHIRVPRLEGLVTFNGNSHTSMMGFLQTAISDPVPLTMKLDTSVGQQKRDAWAEEVERVNRALHDCDIVWGDAKADNFVVDSSDNLWIIDFGGSYTEGWVDAELNETEEGDNMGVEKITNALHDPEANTWDPDESGNEDMDNVEEEKQTDHLHGRPQKRKHSQGEATLPMNGQTTKRRHVADDKRKVPSKSHSLDTAGQRARSPSSDTGSTDDEERYCYCDSSSSGDMVGCDGETCERQWFHFACVGLSEPPPDTERWFCKDCAND